MSRTGTRGHEWWHHERSNLLKHSTVVCENSEWSMGGIQMPQWLNLRANGYVRELTVVVKNLK